jgi:hypothetical protein
MRALRRLPRHLPMLALLALGGCIPPDKRYDYPAWGFSIVFPGPPQVIDDPATPDHGASFEVKLDRDDGQIREVNVVDTAPGETLESITSDHAAHEVAAIAGDAAAPRAVTTPEGVAGREVRFSHDGKPIFIARYFLAGRRLYELDASAIDGFDDPFMAGFLKSLRITGGPGTAATP